VFDQILVTINMWMTGGFTYAVLGCFLWGVVSVLFSPCHLASIPLMIGYVAGQGRVVQGREAAGYASLFSLGLFISIALVGIACSLLGKMLGDIPPLWGLPAGLLFLWLGLDMAGVAVCHLPGGGLSKFSMRGHVGALFLGLTYGIMSGACTFGFIAPILAVITVQQRIMEGIIMILLFALGHCLPIMVAGSSVSLSQHLLSSKSMAATTKWGRKAAGALICLVGVYFIVNAL